MATNKIQEGRLLTVAAPSGGVVSGSLYIIGNIVGVAMADADETDPCVLDTEGVYELPKKQTDGGLSQGDLAVWDDSIDKVAADAADAADKVIGIVIADAATAATTVKVKLFPTVQTKKSVAGVYAVDADDAMANSATVSTGLVAVESAIVQVVDSGNNVVTSDADVTFSGGDIVVADGSTYNTTDGYSIRWIAFGV